MLFYSPSQVAALRMTIACLCLFPFVIRRAKEIPKELWKYVILVGFLGNGIPSFLFTYAETQISSSMAGVLNALTPVFTLLVGLLLFKTRLTFYHMSGVVVGFGGAFFLLMFGADKEVSSQPVYGLLIVAATLCYALSVNIIRNKLHSLDAMLISGWSLMVVGFLSMMYLASTDVAHRFAHFEGAETGILYVVVLALFGTAISLVLYNKLIKMTGALFASSTTYIIPVIALLWGLMDNEKTTPMQLSGFAAILLGVYLVNKK